MATTKFIVDAEVTTIGSDKIGIKSDSSNTSDYFVLSINSTETLKLTKDDVLEILGMLSGAVQARARVK